MKAKTRDEQISEMFDVIQQKKAEILKAEKPNWKTNCSFSSDENSSIRINLQVVQDVNVLISMLAHLNEKKQFHGIAASILGVSTPFTWQGKPYEDWESDIKNRANKILISKKKTELETLETGLNKLISPEKREELEFAALQKNFSELTSQ